MKQAWQIPFCLLCLVAADDPTQRALALLAKMTAQEKVHMLHGSDGQGYTGRVANNSRLNIPGSHIVL